MRPSQVVDVFYAQLGNINEPLVKGHVPLSTTMVLTCFIPRRLISPPEGTLTWVRVHVHGVAFLMW